jgi:molybdopterin-containing oxidoreductase family iron-sulfur binding subunit
VGAGTGFDAGRLRTTNDMWAASATVRVLEASYPLASTQLHSNIETDRFQGSNLEGRAAESRHLIRQATVAEFERQPDFPHHVGHGIDDSLGLMPGFDYSEGHAWGLSVDLNTCTSCNACVIACQSENNIPVVGKEEVAKSREMHWIRLDRYYEGELDDPALHTQPVMCMHCEQAPCEVVCPVAATVHSSEGLNDMVYNRCVGTRYCANNCPYKVRRFNFFKYTDTETPVTKMMRNPDVTVRTRGVMEKCSYCVQRINHARIEARKEDRRVRDGEIETACQQVCPTEAIVFGDQNDADSKVAQLKAEPHDYGLLTDLGTRPRTTYLAKVGNPNPEWPSRAGGHSEDSSHG